MIRKINLKEYEEVNKHWADEVGTTICEILRTNGFHIDEMENLIGQLHIKSRNIRVYINSDNDNRYLLYFKFDTNKVDISATYTDKFIVSNYGVSIQPKEIINMQKAIDKLHTTLKDLLEMF